MNETKSFPEQRRNAPVRLESFGKWLKNGAACFPSYLCVFDFFFPLFTGELTWPLVRRLACLPGRFPSVSTSVAIV
jgi:hypothetical protein